MGLKTAQKKPAFQETSIESVQEIKHKVYSINFVQENNHRIGESYFQTSSQKITCLKCLATAQYSPSELFPNKQKDTSDRLAFDFWFGNS